MVSHKMAEVLSALPTLWFGVFYAFVELVRLSASKCRSRFCLPLQAFGLVGSHRNLPITAKEFFGYR